MNELPKDPFILVSWMNLKLRDYYPSLEELCDDLDIEKTSIIEKLSAIGYEYNPEINQFR